MERIKRDASRVDIDKSDSGDSFVLKMDDADCFYEPDTLDNCWKLVYPDEHTITEAQWEGATAWGRGLDLAARSADPWGAGGMWEWADEDAMADIVLLEEFVKNEDFLWTGLHSWKDAGGLIQYTPGDFDLAYGCLVNYSNYGDPTVWIEYRPELFATAGYSEEFRSRLGQRWAALREGPMAEEAIVARIDAYAATAREALDRNFSLWDISTVNYGSYCYTVHSWQEEDTRVRAWIHDRLQWMDANVQAW
jgi:hypothetical protein